MLGLCELPSKVTDLSVADLRRMLLLYMARDPLVDDESVAMKTTAVITPELYNPLCSIFAPS